MAPEVCGGRDGRRSRRVGRRGGRGRGGRGESWSAGAQVPPIAERRDGGPQQAIQIPPDLRRLGAQRSDVLGKLQYFSSRVERVAVGGQHGPELWVTGDRGVPDSVDGSEEVPHAAGVQSAPLPGGEHPGADLQVQMPVRIPGPGGVVPHRHRLQHLDGHLHLPAARTHPGGRVPGEPADDLGGGAVLRRVVGRGDVRVDRGRQ